MIRKQFYINYLRVLVGSDDIFLDFVGTETSTKKYEHYNNSEVSYEKYK